MNSSMFICKDNMVYIFGSTKEGFLGLYSDDPKIVCSKEVFYMAAASKYLKHENTRVDRSYIDAFTHAKKLLTTKMNKLLKDNYHKKQTVIEKQIIRDTIKKEMDDRIKEYVSYLDSYSKRFPSSEIITLIGLLKFFEEKLKKAV